LYFERSVDEVKSVSFIANEVHSGVSVSICPSDNFGFLIKAPLRRELFEREPLTPQKNHGLRVMSRLYYPNASVLTS
jgi:hypothetical protein